MPERHLCRIHFVDGLARCEKDGCENKPLIMILNFNLCEISENHQKISLLHKRNKNLEDANSRLMKEFTEGSVYL